MESGERIVDSTPPPRIRLGMPEDSHFLPRCEQGWRLILVLGAGKGRLYTMTNRASGRSAAFLAIVLLLGFSGASHAASGAGGVWIPQPEPRAEIKMVAADQLSDADRAVSEPAQTVQSTTVTAPTSQPDAQAQSVVSASDQGSDTTTLIGKIFIGFGTLLTLASAATKMLLT
jgi:hypothetical protein